MYLTTNVTAAERPCAAGPRPAARRVPGRPARQSRRSVPAAARHSPRAGAAARRGLCRAGIVAACRTGLARRPRGLSPYDARWQPGQSLRACGGDRRAGPKAKRHDHLLGVPGVISTPLRWQLALLPLWVCESAFDAMALLTAGVQGWHWAWARDVHTLVFALDAAAVG